MISENMTGVSVKVLADSTCNNGERMTTFEITLPKVLLAELNTMRILSKNFSSSRAIPVGKFNDAESFVPRRWLKNQSGMVAQKEEIDDSMLADDAWGSIINECKNASEKLSKLGVHKQWANRPNDWHIVAKGVLSGTCWENFLWLRDDDNAQPEFQELASKIRHALNEHIPQKLSDGMWHLPYIETRIVGNSQLYFDSNGNEIYVETAKKMSASCCAQASYRKLDDSVKKSLEIYDKLLSMEKKHCSPFEHIATPIETTSYEKYSNLPFDVASWQEGITHVRRDGSLWSGNLKGFIQFRQLIPNNTKW